MIKKRISAFILSALILGQGFTTSVQAQEREPLGAISGVIGMLGIETKEKVSYSRETTKYENQSRNYSSSNGNSNGNKGYVNSSVEGKSSATAKTPVAEANNEVSGKVEGGVESTSNKSKNRSESGVRHFDLYVTPKIKTTTRTTTIGFGHTVIKEETVIEIIGETKEQEVTTGYSSN